MTQRKIDYRVIPPETDGECVAAMEEVLDTCAEPYDRKYPKLSMDEQPIQPLKETRVPIAATRQHPRRVDDEYERAGIASICMFCEPLSGWRQVTVRQRRTKIDWAMEVEELLRARYASAEKVILACDNLNTHTKGAFYEAFAGASAGHRASPGISPHAHARKLAQRCRERIKFHDTSMRHRPTLRDDRCMALGNHRLAPTQQRQTTRRRPAIPNRCRADQTQVGLP